MSFYDRFFSYSVPERTRIAGEAGMSLNYLHKTIYVNKRDPRFRFDNAVALDRASAGNLSFLNFAEGSVDWAYVWSRLTSAKRAGEFVVPRKKRTPAAAKTPVTLG